MSILLTPLQAFRPAFCNLESIITCGSFRRSWTKNHPSSARTGSTCADSRRWVNHVELRQVARPMARSPPPPLSDVGSRLQTARTTTNPYPHPIAARRTVHLVSLSRPRTQAISPSFVTRHSCHSLIAIVNHVPERAPISSHHSNHCPPSSSSPSRPLAHSLHSTLRPLTPFTPSPCAPPSSLISLRSTHASSSRKPEVGSRYA